MRTIVTAKSRGRAEAAEEMADRTYIHGYSSEEQQRLIEQAHYWHELLTLGDLNYRQGESLLEIGCAAGATLGVLGTAFAGLRLAGIDLEARQIDFARQHLASLGLLDVDLRVADARQLPWSEWAFDHVYIMWLLEHVDEADGEAILRRAFRVLKPGGTITVTEPDYTAIRIYPESEDYEYLHQALLDLFRWNGNAIAGRILGALLVAVGFEEVRSAALGFHFFTQAGDHGLRRHIDYLSRFIEPAIPQMLAFLGRDEARLRKGLEFFRSVPDQPRGSLTQVVYRARAKRPPVASV